MSDTPDILKKIIRQTAADVVERSEQVSIRELGEQAQSAPPPRGFMDALRAKLADHQPAVIAEVKRASPSKGLLRDPFIPAEIAADYEQHGAGALSVLTDTPFFQGSLEHLKEARNACTLPILRKDFMVDAYQVYEARAWGADCILLIVAALGDAQLNELTGLAHHLDMDVLVEVHDRAELERVQHMSDILLGINNRDLRTFDTRLETTLSLLELVPEQVLLVTESGILSRDDVQLMREAGVNGFLVGEAFMRAPSPGARLHELFYS